MSEENCQIDRMGRKPGPKPDPLSEPEIHAQRRWLRAIRGHYGLGQADLAEALGVSRSAVGMYETGTPVPADTVARLLRDYPDIVPPLEMELPKGVPRPRSTQTLGDASYLETVPYAELRYAGVVPASTWGDPLSADTSVQVDSKFWGRHRFACRVIGDSCYPALRQGDLTIWESDKNPPHGVIVIAERNEDDGCTVKQLSYDTTLGRDILKPINPRYDSPPDGEGWRATARLVGVIRKADGPEKTWYWEPGLRPRHLYDTEEE